MTYDGRRPEPHYEPCSPTQEEALVDALVTECERLKARVAELEAELLHQIGDHRKCPKCGMAFIPCDATQQSAIDLIHKPN